MLNDGELIEYDDEIAIEKRRAIAKLINIYEGKFNNIGAKIGKAKVLYIKILPKATQATQLFRYFLK